MFKSIRFRIFFLYTLILLAAFSLFSSSIYLYFHHEIYRRVDSLIDVKARGVESAIQAYLKTRKLEEPTGWAAFFSGFGPKEDSFSIITDMLTRAEPTPEESDMRMHVNIFDAKTGKLVASTNKNPAIISIDPGIFKDLGNHTRIYNLSLRHKDLPSIPIRAGVRAVLENGKALYFVQARMSLTPVQQELSKIARSLIMLMLITVAVVSWSGFFLVKVTLRPVDQMVRKIRNIRSDNLGERMNILDTNDEVSLLGRTFNEMLERLERSFEAQRQIVQDLSHELKTPITILRGQLEVALKRPRSLEEYESVMRSGIAEIENIRRIIDDLLMLARLDSRAGTLEMKPLRIDLVVGSMLEDIRALALAKRIDIICEETKPILIEANEIHLRRLFMNLLDNAVKYTPDGGCVELRITEDGEKAVVSIKDNGVGISAEHLPKIFNRFYRADKARKNEGHGLGLGIVKSIVDAHKGTIGVQSAPGQGTIFHVILPKKFSMELFSSVWLKETVS